MSKVTAKLVPKPHAVEQKKFSLAVAQDLLDSINAEPVFLRLLSDPENENAIERIAFSDYAEVPDTQGVGPMTAKGLEKMIQKFYIRDRFVSSAIWLMIRAVVCDREVFEELPEL
ncbi:hypothetical protein TNCV_1323421 [Trichonephila clavipes]|nr:hypothetical protein TNCV_1323421 [Trichonephila clavipes]